MKLSGTNLRREDGTRPASRRVEPGSSLVVGGMSRKKLTLGSN